MDKTYAICNVSSDLEKVDFKHVSQTTPDTVRKSIDATQFIISYGLTPAFIRSGLVVPSSILNHEEALALMKTSEWYQPEEE